MWPKIKWVALSLFSIFILAIKRRVKLVSIKNEHFSLERKKIPICSFDVTIDVFVTKI